MFPGSRAFSLPVRALPPRGGSFPARRRRHHIGGADAPRAASRGSSPGKKQAADRPPALGVSIGVSSRHRGRAIGHRGWKAHPAGGEAGDGGSPASTRRRRPEAGRGAEFVFAAHVARFERGEDLGAAPALAAVAREVGLDPDACVAAADDPARHAQVWQGMAEAQATGIFGVPTFVLDGELFWGNDRLEWLIRRIS